MNKEKVQPAATPVEDIVTQMTRYGGTFIKSLAHTWLLADNSNRAIIETAFAHEFIHYSKYVEVKP